MMSRGLITVVSPPCCAGSSKSIFNFKPHSCCAKQTLPNVRTFWLWRWPSSWQPFHTVRRGHSVRSALPLALNHRKAPCVGALVLAFAAAGSWQ